VVRLTESFRAGFAPEGSLHLSIWDFLADSDQRSQLGRVLEGRLLRAELALPSAMGSVAAEAEAVLDAAVTRHALLTIAPTAPVSAPKSGADTLLADPSLDLSPAIVWIKDLSGRYLKINRRYTDCLRVEAASIQGKTDAELSSAQIVEGPRLLDQRGNGTEPVQLEYTAAPVEGREALTVLRFPLHGLDGSPVAVCGVAAPIAHAATARSEAERLLRIERWAGLSVAAIRAELIQEWQLAEVEPPEPTADPAAAASHPAGSAVPGAAATAELQRLQAEMDATRATMAELENLLAETRASNADLESRRAEEQARSAQLEEAAARAPDEIVSAGQVAELEAALAEVRGRAEAAELAAESARGLGAAGEELAAERARADKAEGEVSAAQARAELADREAVAARARVQGAEREIAAARARVQGAEREIAAARARVAELKGAQATSPTAEHTAAELTARADLERRLAEAQRHADQAEQGLAGARAERAEAAGARGELAARAEEAERSLAGVRAEVDAAQGEAAARVAAAEQSLAAERVELLARAAQAERALAAERAEAGQARGELAARAEQAEAALAAERAGAGQARGELAARAEQAEAALAAERAEAGQARGELAARAEQAEAALAEVRATGERASVAAERAEAAAGLARGRADGLEATLASARQTEAETRAALEQARAEVDSLQQAVAQARTEAATAQEAARRAAEGFERERRELADRPPALAPAPAPAIAPSPSGPSWSHSAQRALTSSIADASEWRNGLKDALRTVGVEGGWDVVVAWCPDERANAFRCVAMWMAAPGEHALFETSTWQRRLSPAASQVGRAAAGEHANWVNDLTSADDAQLAAAAGQGMRTALLVPLRRAGETSGVLELLTSAPGGLGPEVSPAMEAVGLQLAHFEYLLRRGAEPRWRMGRL
jgi:hypothetical protein